MILKPLERGSSAGEGQPLPVTDPGLTGRSYEAICGWSLSMLDLKAGGRSHKVNKGQLPPILGQRLPLAALKAQQLKEPWVILEAGFQGVTRVGQVVFSRLVQIQSWCQC